MTRTIILTLAAASIALAQQEMKQLKDTAITIATTAGGFMGGEEANPVQGAPYSATLVNESIQTLADGNRIVQRSTGTTARDSEGRTRQDVALPQIGNMSATDQPRLVFIHDPVAQTSYTLNLTEKTAHKMGAPANLTMTRTVPPGAWVQPDGFGSTAIAGRVTAGPGGGNAVFFKKRLDNEQSEIRTEDLGTETLQGVSVQGVRTTRTIPAGEIGNDRPIEIVTEVWTSPELKTVVSSKRTDPRSGEQTFTLTNIVRSEPDASLFTVPSDFKVTEGPETKGKVMFYHSNE